MFKKILVPTDGSKSSENALKLAVSIAKEFSSELILLHVAEATYNWGMPADAWGWSATLYDEMVEELRKRGERIFDEAKELALKKISSVRTWFEIGSPVDTICEVAKKEACDLIVMGSRGLSDVKGVFLGSVSHGVLKRSHCPVLLVKGALVHREENRERVAAASKA